MLTSELREVPGRNGRGVRQRLIERAHQARGDPDEVGLHLELVVLGAISRCQLAGVDTLVEGLAAMRITHREGLHGSVGVPNHQGHDCARVDSTRKEGTEGYVGDQPCAHRLVQLSAQPLRRCHEIHARIGLVAKLPVGLDLEPTALGDQDMTRAQLVDALEHGERLGDVQVGQKVVHCGGPQPAGHLT